MSKKTESTLHFTVGRSRRLRQLLDGLHALSLLACWVSDLSVLWQFMLSLLVAASWLIQSRACEAVRIFLSYTVAEGWAVSFDGECYHAVSVKPSTVVSKMLTVLHFSVEKRSRTLVIMNDAMSANDYRRLIVNLKISGYSQR